MGIEKNTAMDKKVTQNLEKSFAPSPRRSSSSHQKELPLKRASNTETTPSSKVLFQLRSELNRLQTRDREWKLMFNMLGHDLKEPLLTLEGFTKLLEEGATSPQDQKRYLKVIREAINSLHLLVGSLQSVGKLYHDPNELVELSVREIFSNVLSSLSKQIAKTKGRVTFDFADDIILRGDPVRLYQIFLNLIANSLKFHKKDSPPEISISARMSQGFLKISIADNGVGMSNEDLKRIFEPFTRLEHSQGSTEGMGLGLSIVKRIAESFGGRVVVRSQSGIGTIFSVMIPRAHLIKGVSSR